MKSSLVVLSALSLALFNFNTPVNAQALIRTSEASAISNPVPNYIGVGTSIGLENDNESATIFTKIGMTDSISIRPSMTIQDDLAVDMPLTYDLALNDRVSPYLGIGPGVIFKEHDTDVNPIATAGVDVKLSEQFIANVNVKTDVTDTDDIAVNLGLGLSLP